MIATSFVAVGLDKIQLLNFGSPAILGSFVAIERRGGGEDPWLCVSSFGWFCLYRRVNSGLLETAVNSGMYLNPK